MSRFLIDRYAPLEPYTPGEQPQDMQYIKLNTNEFPYPPAPEVLAAVDFPQALELVKTCDRVFVGALTNPPPPSLLEAVSHSLGSPESNNQTIRQSGRSLGLFVGPEGDFTPAELESLLAIAVPTSFGPTILRAEAAAIFGLSVLAATQH